MDAIKDIKRAPVSFESLRLDGVGTDLDSSSSGSPEYFAPKQDDNASSVSVDSAERARLPINAAIATINLAENATTEIEKFVKSLGGLFAQVQQSDIPERRLLLLNQEATQLVQAIVERAQTSTDTGTKPLAGDPITVEVSGGSAITVKLPSSAIDAFGLSQVKSDTPVLSKGTPASFPQVESQLNELKKAVEASKAQLKSAAAVLEVALQNSEAASSSVRDLNTALSLAESMRNGVTTQPTQALASIGPITRKASHLLA